MEQKDKELLLKDLCARLPYETMFYSDRYGEECLLSIDLEYNKVNELYSLEEIKPYLRPMSSMTEEEKREYSKCMWAYQDVDFCNEHHLDYRGLIDKELSLEAPEGMYKTKED